MSHEQWTTDNVPDLTGKRVVVTGGNTGIGLEVAKVLVEKGAHTILACLDLGDGQAAVNTLKQAHPQASVEALAIDLGDLASVRSFSAEFTSKHDRLDLLINNAGVMLLPYGTTKDGFERQLGINFFGHFALTGLLLDVLQRSDAARVVTVSSKAHDRGVIDFDDLNFEGGRGYRPMFGYRRSKLAVMLFAYELDRRLKSAESTTRSIAAHPGIASTGLAKHFYNRWYLKPLERAMQRTSQPASMGALPTLRAAVDPNARGGTFYGPDGPRERNGYPVIVKSSAASHNTEDAARLWSAAEQLTGVHYLSQ